jgi:capsular polysaccharide biosynthesis protein
MFYIRNRYGRIEIPDETPLHTSIRPIAQAATSTAYFERARVHRGRSEIRLDDVQLRQPSGLRFQATGVTSTVRNFTIANAVLDADTGLLFHDQLEIPETSYFVPEGAGRDRQTRDGNLVRLDDSEDFIIAYNNAHLGYQHWLTQCVPAIDWALRQERTRPVRLVLPVLTSWQEDILDILGYGRVPRLTLQPNTRYWLPHVEYSEFLNGSTSFGVCLSGRDTARRILDRLSPTPARHPILFVPCSNPYYGTIRNEAEVIDLFRRLGVHIVDQRLSTAARINLFRHAQVVIGPHGQGLVDIQFCKPGTLLWEWMPRHHQNASINRLAQAAEADYWGDLFESDPGSHTPGQWFVNLDTVTQRLSEATQRLTSYAAGIGLHPVVTKPLSEVMLSFESLGDNCEFGLVQRHAGAEPLGLLRFAGISLGKLVAALEAKFDGVGAIDNVTVYLAGEPSRREFMVHETSLDMRYHTSMLEGEIEAEHLRKREAGRLGFLRRKLLEDLAGGEKIWVWRELGMTDPARLLPLMAALRSLGPNIMLWVVEAVDVHPAGTVERLDRDFMKGYVERLAPYENATDISPAAWFEVCENAYKLRYLDRVKSEPAGGIVVPLPRSLPAKEFLALNQATVQSAPPAQAV